MRAPRVLRDLCPVQSVDSILEIDLQDLRSAGKKLLLLDLDNTLTEWRSEEIPETTRTWIEEAKAVGFDLCILSNTRNPERLARLAEALGVASKFGKFKPSRQMFLDALTERNLEPDDAIMIGDQMFTDILGANRSGIDAILVRQMAPREFVGTRINRIGERIVRARVNRALLAGENDLVGGAAAFAMLSNPTVRQFVKFCIVGGTSTVVDAGLHYLLMFVVPFGAGLLSQEFGKWLIAHGPSFVESVLATKPDGTLDPGLAASPIFKIFTAGLAILNSFVWNRSWTFGVKGKQEVGPQLRKFYMVAISGLIINTILMTLMQNIIPGHAKISWAVATAIATIAVAFWNFFMQRKWTFGESPSR